MKVKLIPGPRDEEKIAAYINAKIINTSQILKKNPLIFACFQYFDTEWGVEKKFEPLYNEHQFHHSSDINELICQKKQSLLASKFLDECDRRLSNKPPRFKSVFLKKMNCPLIIDFN